MKDLVKVTTFEEDILVIKDSTTKVFLVTGKILKGIQDNKKYKEAGYKTFAEAVKVELGLEKRNAYYLIGAASVYENVNYCSQNLPTSETQLRPMAKLSAPKQVEVWQEVAKDKIPTAKEVQTYVNEKFPKEKKATKKVSIVDTTNNNSTINITTIENCTNCFAHEAENAALKIRVKELNDTITTLLPYADQVIELEEKLRLLYEEPVSKINDSFVAASVVKIPNSISREKAFALVKKYGNEIQSTILKKDGLTNEDLFKVFIKVREQYKSTTPPPAWDEEIINADFII